LLWHLMKGLRRLLVIIVAFLVASLVFIVADHKIFGGWKRFKKDALDGLVWVWRGGQL
jgi:hypothetical protein